jgi:hypothetical protein
MGKTMLRWVIEVARRAICVGRVLLTEVDERTVRVIWCVVGRPRRDRHETARRPERLRPTVVEDGG